MKKIIFLILCLLPMYLQAQQMNADSLVNVLETQKLTSEQKLQLYWNILLCYWNTDLDKNIMYANEAIKYSEKEQNYLWAARFNRALGISYTFKDEFDQALHVNEKAIYYAVKVGNKGEELAAKKQIGDVYMDSGKEELAMQVYIDLLPSLEKMKIYGQYCNVLLCIAKIYSKRNNSEKALEYTKQALDISDKHDFTSQKMAAYSRIGNIYSQKEQLDSAIVYVLKSYKIACSLNDKLNIITCTQMLAGMNSDLGNHETAEKYANECLNTAIEVGDKQQLRVAWITMANVNYGLKQYNQCDIYASKAWESDSTDLQQAQNASALLCLANIFLNNHEKASLFFQKYQNNQTQMNNKKLYDSLAEMETKYETEKKELRIATLERERKLYYGLGAAAAVAFLLGLGLLFYRHRLTEQKRKTAEQQIKQLEQEKELMEQEKELIVARTTLDAEKTERQIIARDLHDEVGTMLSVVKNNMDIYSTKSYSIIENTEIVYFNEALSVLDKAMTGLRRIAHHIMPSILIEKGLLSALDDFCRSIPEAEFHFNGTDRRFDSEKEIALYRCAYELVNNALRHAKASCIKVHLNMDEKTVYLSVEDNGCGFDTQTTPAGMGMENLRTRLSAFGGSIEIYSELGKGTEANVEMEV